MNLPAIIVRVLMLERYGVISHSIWNFDDDYQYESKEDDSPITYEEIFHYDLNDLEEIASAEERFSSNEEATYDALDDSSEKTGKTTILSFFDFLFGIPPETLSTTDNLSAEVLSRKHMKNQDTYKTNPPETTLKYSSQFDFSKPETTARTQSAITYDPNMPRKKEAYKPPALSLGETTTYGTSTKESSDKYILYANKTPKSTPIDLSLFRFPIKVTIEGKTQLVEYDNVSLNNNFETDAIQTTSDNLLVIPLQESKYTRSYDFYVRDTPESLEEEDLSVIGLPKGDAMNEKFSPPPYDEVVRRNDKDTNPTLDSLKSESTTAATKESSTTAMTISTPFITTEANKPVNTEVTTTGSTTSIATTTVSTTSIATTTVSTTSIATTAERTKATVPATTEAAAEKFEPQPTHKGYYYTLRPEGPPYINENRPEGHLFFVGTLFHFMISIIVFFFVSIYVFFLSLGVIVDGPTKTLENIREYLTNNEHYLASSHNMRTVLRWDWEWLFKAMLTLIITLLDIIHYIIVSIDPIVPDLIDLLVLWWPYLVDILIELIDLFRVLKKYVEVFIENNLHKIHDVLQKLTQLHRQIYNEVWIKYRCHFKRFEILSYIIWQTIVVKSKNLDKLLMEIGREMKKALLRAENNILTSEGDIQNSTIVILVKMREVLGEKVEGLGRGIDRFSDKYLSYLEKIRADFKIRRRTALDAFRYILLGDGGPGGWIVSSAKFLKDRVEKFLKQKCLLEYK